VDHRPKTRSHGASHVTAYLFHAVVRECDVELARVEATLGAVQDCSVGVQY